MALDPADERDLLVTRGHRSWQVHAPAHLSPAALDAALAEVQAAGGGPTYLWVHEPTEDDDVLAGERGFALGRDLYQLRVDLPLDDPALTTRPFRPEVDDDAWLTVNNRAFSWHPEQGGWTRAQLQERIEEPWFDPHGFLLHERDGRLAGFCWTKVHDAHEATGEPVLGEIYVIAVDPDFVGLGLGRALTLAGLRWLHDERGVTTGMLYVDASNTAAVGLYEKLGFTRCSTDRAYYREMASRSSPRSP
jgi:mycothiol synthase